MNKRKSKLLTLTTLVLLFVHFSSFAQNNLWTWVDGSNISNDPGVYPGVRTPGNRQGAVQWKDANGNLWVFGGFSYTISGSLVYLNDLWKYSPAANQWTWIGGSNTANQPGSYGTQGINAASNVPGARQKSVSWTDASGNFWLFGGFGYTSSGSIGSLNDLWKYNPSTGQWTWMKGSNTVNQPGSYGTLNTAAASNIPGARQSSATWIDASGDLWLLGGYGYPNSSASSGYLNDLWRYSPSSNQWTWMGGSNTLNQLGSYGTQGAFAASNLPGARYGSSTWTDASGNLWLFGGTGYGSTSTQGNLNDLWEYAPASGQWTYVGGSNTINQSGNYGTQGIASTSNIPGARLNSTSYTDASGNFWLIGGNGYGNSATLGNLNDIWKFNPSTGLWTWMGGNNNINQPGSYGTQGATTASNMPGSRQGSSSWIDATGNLWLLGGYGNGITTGVGYLNDLWEYTPATGLWVWMGGSNILNQPGNYGIKGNPNLNRPGARYYSSTWTDANGNFWLFGGNNNANTSSTGYLNDFWKYSPSTNQWTLVRGDYTANQPGSYGTQGVSAASNMPGARQGSSTWTDPSGNLWLFGGSGYGSTATQGILNDLWKFNPTSNQWTWMGGSNTTNQPGNYGTQGTTAVSNIPGARHGSSTWIDASGNLWLFGGSGYGSTTSSSSNLNDLWKFSPSSNQWTWMGGSNVTSQPGNYGTQGVSAASNMPGARLISTCWTDASGNFWLFGGAGYGSTTLGNLNDLWKYSPITGQWTWMGGSNSVNQAGSYGLFNLAAASNMPGGRQGAMQWTDASGNFWLFGGYGYPNTTASFGFLNDIWKYSPSTGMWTWVGGNNTVNQLGVYGTQGAAASSNMPGGRYSGSTWTDATGNLWLFGGYGMGSTTDVGYLNDLWKLTPFISVLPIHFLSFKGLQKNEGVQLEWATINEDMGSYYEVQRSGNLLQFTTIASEEGSKSQQGSHTYNYLDVSPVSDKNYYRIRWVSPSGKVVYSDIVEVNTKNERSAVNLYPNPVTGNNISLQMSGLKKGSYLLKLYNTAGVAISSQLILYSGGKATQSITLPSTLSKGMYHFTLSGMSSTYNATLIKK